ncbi:hypothetical protein TrVFT333_002669 [Trichoderma virens FT-333]|nr:hypothetical protein TrVFT333_002669 [Trichoderma virens FT-333]
MGRPLFVAPVETDLPHKDATKRDVLSPSRSAIRRSTQTETRERRNPNRRTGVRIVALQPHNRSTRSYPAWGLDDGTRHLTPSLYDHEEPSSGPAREALRDVTSRPPRSDRRLEDRMSSLFGGTWHNIGPPLHREMMKLHQTGTFGGISKLGRNRGVRASKPPRRNRSPHGRRSYHIGTPPYRPTRDGSERLQSESATSNDDTAPQYAFAPYRSLRRNQARAFRTFMGADASSRIRQRTHATDGLGDRDRSLSPEVWDTLLTTLTPDPQPPSASSSFASAAVSQSAGPSNAPPPAPGLPDETADGACESGHEMSEDEEGVLYRFPHEVGTIDEQLRRHFRRRPSVPDYNLDGPSDGPLDRPLDGPQSHRPEASRRGSEDERGADRTRPNREGSAGSGPGVQTGDEEWLGMRRIVQSLAAREDIPDEWWAEAGLSRTLPHDESN